MVVQCNLPGMNAWRNFQIHNSRIATAIERISSGYKINRAADDAAGLAISERMKAQITHTQRQQRNIEDQLSMTEIKDGTLSEIQTMLNRMGELANASMNGTYTDAERKKMDAEYQELMKGIAQMQQGLSAFKPLSMFGGPEKPDGAPSGGASGATLQGGNLNAFLDGLDQFLLDISKAAAANDAENLLKLGIDPQSGAADSQKLRAAVVRFTAENAQRLLDTPLRDGTQGPARYSITTSGGNVRIALAGGGANPYGLDGSNLLTAEAASKALDRIKSAAEMVANQRGGLGAEQSRLAHTLEVLASMDENMTAALSRILDTDMAKEMITLVREQFLSQAAMFAMSMARQQPEQVLELLRAVPAQLE